MTTALSQAAEDWYATLTILGRASGTVKLRRERLGAAIQHLLNHGCLRPADVSATDLDAYLQECSERGLSRDTLRSHRSTLRGFFSWLFDRRRLLRNPADDLDIGTRQEQPLREKPLSETEVRLLLEAIPTRTASDLCNRCLLELIYGCGLRLNEALTLRLDDLQLDVGVITVHAKGGMDAQLPILPSALAVLQDYLAVRRLLVNGPDCGLLFLSRDGKKIPHVTVQQWISKLGKRVLGSERRVHPHLFRHSIAVHLLRRGLDIRYLQSFLRHVDLDTTKQYLRLTTEHLRQDYDDAMPNIAPDLSGSLHLVV